MTVGERELRIITKLNPRNRTVREKVTRWLKRLPIMVATTTDEGTSSDEEQTPPPPTGKETSGQVKFALLTASSPNASLWCQVNPFLH